MNSSSYYFSDASEKVFGAVVYTPTVDKRTLKQFRQIVVHQILTTTVRIMCSRIVTPPGKEGDNGNENRFQQFNYGQIQRLHYIGY